MAVSVRDWCLDTFYPFIPSMEENGDAEDIPTDAKRKITYEVGFEILGIFYYRTSALPCFETMRYVALS